MATLPITKAELVVGKVIKLSKLGLRQTPCVQLRCRQMDYSEHLRNYFVKYTDLWALDTDAKAQMGDTVLIRRSDSKELKTGADVQHLVERVIFKYGMVIDPITKRRAIGNEWADELELKKTFVHEIVEGPERAASSYAEQRKLQTDQLNKLSRSTIDD